MLDVKDQPPCIAYQPHVWSLWTRGVVVRRGRDMQPVGDIKEWVECGKCGRRLDRA